MKTYIRSISILILSSFTFAVNAQLPEDNTRSASPWISKDIVKVINKDVVSVPHLTIKSVGTPEYLITKGVNKKRSSAGYQTAEPVPNMVSKTYPDLVISKPTNRVKG